MDGVRQWNGNEMGMGMGWQREKGIRKGKALPIDQRVERRVQIVCVNHKIQQPTKTVKVLAVWQ